MQKKIPIFIVISIICIGGIYWFYAEAKKRERAENKAIAKRQVCELYLYDKNNPSTHGSMGPEFHHQKWQQYERAFGPSGKNGVEEFCSQ